MTHTQSARIELTARNFPEEVLESPLPVMVEFGAEWSGTCHIMAPVLEKLALLYEGRFKIGRVDIEQDEELTIRYGINTNGHASRTIPTFLFFHRGQVVDHLLKSVPERLLVEKIEYYVQSISAAREIRQSNE